MIVAPADVKANVRRVQESFRALNWIASVPDYFLHVSVCGAADVDFDRATRPWSDVEPFELAYRRANCFHDAAIIEVRGNGVRMLVERAFPQRDLSLFLPHMSIGYFKNGETPEQLRSALTPFRETDFGSGIVDEVFLCEVPIAKSTFLQPWRVVDSVKLEPF